MPDGIGDQHQILLMAAASLHRPVNINRIVDIHILIDNGNGFYEGKGVKGKLRGLWSVRVSGNWRIVFRFKNGDAFDVDYLDYH